MLSKGRGKAEGAQYAAQDAFGIRASQKQRQGLHSCSKTQPSLKGQGVPGYLYFSSAFSGWTILALHLPRLRNTHTRKIKICHQKKQRETLPAAHAGIHQHPEGIISGKRGFSAPHLLPDQKGLSYTPLTSLPAKHAAKMKNFNSAAHCQAAKMAPKEQCSLCNPGCEKLGCVFAVENEFSVFQGSFVVIIRRNAE